MPAKVDLMMRRERVKALILSGMSQKEIAKEVGVSEDVVRSDIWKIGNESILKRTAEVVEDAYLEFSTDIDWAVSEAVKMHENENDLNALRFVVDTKSKKLSTAQSLGLLEQAAKKIELTEKREINPEKAKLFGDYLASMTEDE